MQGVSRPRVQQQEDLGPETSMTFKRDEIKPKPAQPKQDFILGTFTSSERQHQHHFCAPQTVQWLCLPIQVSSNTPPVMIKTGQKMLGKYTVQIMLPPGCPRQTSALPSCSKAKQEQVTTSAILSRREAATSRQAAGYTNNTHWQSREK